MSWTAGALLGFGVLIAALWLYGLGYSVWANASWPASGRIVRANGARIHVLDAGNGPLVLAIHGASANAREVFTPLTAALGLRYRVIAMDRPGAGHSSRPRRANRLETQAALAAAVIEDADQGPAIVVAHSLGAGTALRLAIDHPDLVAGLVLVAPASHPYPGGNAWHAHVAATPLIGPFFASTLPPVVGPFALPDAVENTFSPADPPAGYARNAGVGLLFRPSAFVANARDVTASKREFAAQAPRYPEIMAPTIVITAERDPVVSVRLHALALAEDLPAVELMTLNGVGHMPHRVRPDAVAAAVRRVATMAAPPRER